MTKLALIRKPIIQPTEILSQLQTGQLLRVNGTRGNALIIMHRHHAELAGSGAAVGGLFDADCTRVIPIGTLSLVYPESRYERQKAYQLRQRWILFTQHAMTTYVPLHRAKILLSLLYKYFDAQFIDELSDDVIAQLVGVLPKTIGTVRRSRRSPTQQKPQTRKSVGV
jgi:hypothetical protein